MLKSAVFSLKRDFNPERPVLSTPAATGGKDSGLTFFMELLQEEWEPIEGFPNHAVSNLGRVRNNNSGIILKTQLKVKDGRASPNSEYLFVELNKGGKRFRKIVHRLVAAAFIPKIAGKPLVNHKDANKWNNRADNLEWVNHKENAEHAVFMGLNRMCMGEPPVTKDQIPLIKEAYRLGVEKICTKFNISKQILVRIVSGKEYQKHIITNE